MLLLMLLLMLLMSRKILLRGEIGLKISYEMSRTYRLSGYLVIGSVQGERRGFWRCESGLLMVLVNRKMLSRCRIGLRILY